MVVSPRVALSEISQVGEHLHEQELGRAIQLLDPNAWLLKPFCLRQAFSPRPYIIGGAEKGAGSLGARKSAAILLFVRASRPQRSRLLRLSGSECHGWPMR